MRRDAGHAVAPLGIGDVARQAVLVDLLERERRRDDAPVELRDRDLVGRVERRDAVVVGEPLLAARGQAEALQDRDVERRHAGDVPRLVVAAGRGRRRRGSAGREHRDDQRVERAERRVEVVRGRAQRAREDRQADGVARGVDRVGERMGEVLVAGGVVGAVEQHADAREVGRRLRAIEPAPGRHLLRRVESLAREQHGVGRERVQLREVGRAALDEVAVRLGRDADGNGRHLHELGVRGELAAEHDHGLAGRADAVEAGTEVLGGAEDPGDHEVGRLDRLGHGLVALDLAGRVGPQVVGTAGAGRQQVGVGRGQQCDASHDVLLRGSRPMGDGVRWSVSGCRSPLAAGRRITVAEPPRTCTGFLGPRGR